MIYELIKKTFENNVEKLIEYKNKLLLIADKNTIMNDFKE